MSGEKHDPRGLDSPLVRWSEHCAAVDEARHDQTRQRQFEQKFLSTDWVNEYEDTFEQDDGGRAVERLVDQLDAPFLPVFRRMRRHRRERRFRQALHALRDYPELAQTLRAIRRLRRREKIFSALKIRPETYRKRFSDLTKILKSRLVIQRAAMTGNVPAGDPLQNEQGKTKKGQQQ